MKCEWAGAHGPVIYRDGLWWHCKVAYRRKQSKPRKCQVAWSCGCGVAWCGVGVLVYMMRVTNDSRDEINKCADDYYGSPITFVVPRCLKPLPNVQSPARGC